MNYTYRVLKEDIDFFVAAMRQDLVVVWHVLEDQENIIDYGGVVEGYSEVSVKIAGNRFFRDKFEFRIVGSKEENVRREAN
ncbi:hypothetical protein KQ941_02770 [Paenibacillus xylanexedens]|uniref:hypothetical protein n=1 Tax=Paenibacillus xylanexedens TaxID=528191 RepID=UPI001F39FFBF|nr:hypothetical protein [Paenibacillus xylanexedens]MCF7753352.1 hypothetical protein [Paenibacillus xylanexedens]